MQKRVSGPGGLTKRKKLESELLFSLALPVSEQANFLPTVLSSIRAQTGRFQLAVMDATPNNSVQAVLKNYAEILRYQRHGPDAGQSAAIQEGWDHTEGDIVSWLCADDYYFPYTLEEVAKAFSAHPDVDVVYGDSVIVDHEGNFLRYFFHDDLSAIFQWCCISQPSCFLRRSALDRMGKLNTQLHYIMDWDLWTQLYKAGAKFHYLNKPLSVVRMYPETKTASRSKARYAEINRHLKENVGFLSRMLFLLGCYYADLKTGRKSMIGRSIYRVLNRLRWKYSKKKNTFLYGFERSSHLVKGECEIFLPFYDQDLPRQLVINCKNVKTLQVSVNDRMQNISSSSSCRDYCRYVVNIKEDLTGSILKLNLSSRSTKLWELISVNMT